MSQLKEDSMEKEGYRALRNLSKEDRDAIFEYAMRCSEEVMRGLDDVPSKRKEKNADSQPSQDGG